MAEKPLALRDMATGALALAMLALAFTPLLGDGAARMKVHFRTATATPPQHFTAETSQSVCTLFAAALAYENPPTGAYTRVVCSARPKPP